MTKEKEIRRFPRLRTVPEGHEWSSEKVFTTVYDRLNSQIHFTWRWQPVVVTLWAMGTYLHRRFPAYGHLWLNSPTTHSGKSKLLNVLWTICHKALEPQLDPTAAALFRFPSAIGGTLLLDEIDNLDEKKRGDVIAVLNHYYKSGVVVRSVPSRNRKFNLEKLPVYCPKVIAGIQSLPVHLQDRCIKILLHRKKPNERVHRFLPEHYERQEEMRNQMEAWASRKGRAIVAAYRDRKHLGVPHEVSDDRVKDILEPLFAIASVMPEWVQKQLTEGTREIAKERKLEEGESNPVVAATQVLTEKFPKGIDTWKLRSEHACELLGDIPGLEERTQVLSTLRKLGFRSKPSRSGKQVFRSYPISRRRLEKLSQRYS